MITAEAPPAENAAPTPIGVAEFHQQFATELFDHVLALLDRTDRNCAENDRMIHMAHTCRFHWELGGTAMNIALGEWICARVHTALSQSDTSLYHAWRYLEHAENYGLGPFHVGQAHAALSGAFTLSKPDEAVHHLSLAHEMKEHVSDEQELAHLENEIKAAETTRERIAMNRPACC